MGQSPNIGRLAENEFRALCSRHNVICNQSTEDEKGWDFLLQFRTELEFAPSMDLTEPAPNCFVQVKTNSGKFSGVKLKLSNASEFVLIDQPCFVLLFDYTQSGQSNMQCHVLHFGEKELTRVLKRLREVDPSDALKVNQQMIYFQKQDMLSVNTSDLIDHLRTTILRYSGRYAETKRKLRESIGFKKMRYHLSATIDSNFAQDFVDMQLGLKDRVPVRSFAAYDERFGISGKNFVVGNGAGAITFRVKPKKCCVILSSDLLDLEISVPGELRVAGLAGRPREDTRARVISCLVDLIIDSKTNSVDYKFNLDLYDQQRFSVLNYRVDVLWMMRTGHLRMTIFVRNKILYSIEATTKPQCLEAPLQELQELLVFITNCVADQAALKKLQVNLPVLMVQDQALQMCRTMIQNDPILASCEIDTKSLPPQTRSCILLFYFPINFGAYSIYVMVRAEATAHVTDRGVIEVTTSRYAFKRGKILKNTVEDQDDYLRQELTSSFSINKDDIIFYAGNALLSATEGTCDCRVTGPSERK